MKMNKKLSLILVAAMFSLLIIGFGGAATADAAGKCAETLLANGASESTAFTNCRAYEADAARYNAMAAFYANEKTHAQRAFEANVARYTGLAAFYTNETSNVQRAFEADAARYTGLAAFYTAKAAGTCLGIGSTDMTTAAELVNCLSDSTYQAANPELMVSHRFVVDGGATAEPVSDSAYLAANPELMASRRFVVADGSATSQPVSVDVEFQQNLALHPNYFYPGR